MLSKTLQDEIEHLLAHVNAVSEQLRKRAERPNFELVYEDEIIHPQDSNIKLCAFLDWHDELYVGKLTIDYRKFDNLWGWGIDKLSIQEFAVVEDSRSDAIRWAQKEIKSREAAFIDAVASEIIPTPNPSPLHGEGNQNEEGEV